MIEDWAPEIVKNVLVQQRIEELDTQRMWTRHLPNVAASEDEIAATETQLGFALDAEYRSFLRFANGWKCLYQHVDLFGTQQLLGGALRSAADVILDEIGSDLFQEMVGAPVDRFLVIAASSVQSDLFLIAQPGRESAGTVLWISNGLVDRFPSFGEFYLSMVDYNREEIKDLELESR